jgi:uncharacterized repeat protein (TIGR03803 family)
MPIRKSLIILIAIFTAMASAFAASTEKVLYSFCSVSGCTDGAVPLFGSLVFDSAGNLYGTTAGGGNVDKCDGKGCGTVFQLAPGANGHSWTHTVLYRFSGKDGAYPCGLIFDPSGNLYGTTQAGGSHNAGTVYQLKPLVANRKWQEKTLHSFSGKDGKTPNPSLILDAAGNLYGTTQLGGGEKLGVVFQLAPSANGTWSETILHSNRTGADGPGEYGQGGLTFDAAGSLYGTTVGGGITKGEVFRLRPGANGKWKEEVLYSSFGGTNGAVPPGGLIFDTAGNLYGTTNEGGNISYCGGSGCGVVFELSPTSKGTWTETVLYSFKGSDGWQPNTRLVFDGTGNLYGTTAFGGSSNADGTVFELTPGAIDAWAETTLYNFCTGSSCTDGANPYAGLIFDTVGNLYGTTSGGGTHFEGTVFKITP